MPIDYYMVLGIEREADLPRIKRAYREAIKRYHPDKGGSATDPDKFMQAQEAYEVLSDEDRRRAYDAQSGRDGIPVPVTNVRSDIARRRRAWRSLRDTVSPLEAFFEGLLPGYRRPPPSRAAVPDTFYMEVVLSPDEARQGGTFPVALPVPGPCPLCDRGPGWGQWVCPRCRGRGVVRTRREFDLTIPPRITDGTTAEVPLEGIGLPDRRLVVDVRVGAAL